LVAGAPRHTLTVMPSRDASTDSLASALEALAATPEGLLPRGLVVDDRFRVERVLGEGGMGVVYLARDLALDRQVAIKLGSEQSSRALARLSREALLLARLSHPNVVVIYQVGEIGGRFYVAMEYVAGGTARSWRSAADCTWREIVELYVGAGTGLSAAHDAGIVHRDFKPDNVLVGEDGRPRVADFGLARVSADVAAGPVSSGRPAPGSTRSNAVAGTPAYMAPEQIAGGLVDARADQFAFCASLWESLFGVRPFAGDGAVNAARIGAPSRPPDARGARVPRHVENALRRGLRANREERWPTLRSLLDELRRDPARRRARLAIAFGAVASIGLAAAGVVHRRASDPCAASETALSDVWSPQNREQLRGALAPGGSPAWMERVGAGVVAGIDAWAGRFAARSRAVCEAGRGAWSPAMRDRGVECLAQRKAHLVAAVRVLEERTPHLAEHADEVLAQLGAPESCSDPAYLGAAVPPPDDAGRARQVRAEEAVLASALATADAGRAREGRTLADGVVARSEELSYPPLVAHALYARARAERLGRDHAAAFEDLHEAYFVAHGCKDSETAAAVASEAALVLLNLSRDSEAPDWARLATADAVIAADPPSEARALHALAVVSSARGDRAHGLDYAERYVEAARRLPGADLVAALATRSSIRFDLGETPEALTDLDEAILELERSRGGDHPTMAALQAQRARILADLHRDTEAIAAARRALAVAEATNGPDGRLASDAVAALELALDRAHQFEAALAASDRALSLSRSLDGVRSYNAASDLNNRADLLGSLHRPDDALAALEESSSIMAEVVGPDSMEVGAAQLNEANISLEAEHYDRLLAPATRAVAIFAKTPKNLGYAKALVALGIALLHARDYGRARETLLDGLARLTSATSAVDPEWTGQGQLALAQVQLALGDRTSARASAATACDALAKARDQPRANARARGLLQQLSGGR
jgi:predicted Ser/Thr protein kinase